MNRRKAARAVATPVKAIIAVIMEPVRFTEDLAAGTVAPAGSKSACKQA